MQIKKGSSITDTAVVLLLIGVFVLLATGVLTLGVSVYNNTTDSASENYTHRTALSYIANQVRRGDTAGGIEVCSLNGVDALALRSEISGTSYITYLYCYDGQLRELFTEEGVEQELASGTVVMPLEELGFILDGGNIDVTATDGAGNAHSLILSPRSGVAKAEG